MLSQFNVILFKEEQLYESLKPALGLLESPINLYRSSPAAVPLMGEEVTCAQTKVTAILLLEGEEQRLVSRDMRTLVMKVILMACVEMGTTTVIVGEAIRCAGKLSG
jgi:hypothetical protein